MKLNTKWGGVGVGLGINSWRWFTDLVFIGKFKKLCFQSCYLTFFFLQNWEGQPKIDSSRTEENEPDRLGYRAVMAPRFELTLSWKFGEPTRFLFGTDHFVLALLWGRLLLFKSGKVKWSKIWGLEECSHETIKQTVCKRKLTITLKKASGGKVPTHHSTVEKSL